MSTEWVNQAIFYHIYPLGLCGAPEVNHFSKPLVHRLDTLHPWLEHIQSIGANAIYLGPVFQSMSHGYDTVDYYQVDRRLGDHQTLQRLSEVLHRRGMRLVLDGVFNHVGRDFWAFKDVIENGPNSDYKDWFHNLRFGEGSPKGDPFTYESWHGHYSLVKLNLSNPDLRAHLFDAISMWRSEFGIDGLRLDAADSIDFDFLRALREFTAETRPGFWLMGEVVHGDYRQWANPSTLHTVTNYEAYKGLYSSLNDGNYHEIAYTLNRQFGSEGIYRDLQLYNFVDNHDVDRVASKLNNPTWLYPLYILLFTMPGIPAIYYGSEWGVQGKKETWSDAPLRPKLDLEFSQEDSHQGNLVDVIQQLAHIRSQSSALKGGHYSLIFVSSRQFAFLRESDDETILVILNSAEDPVEIYLEAPGHVVKWVDLLDTNQSYTPEDRSLFVTIPPTWGRILKAVGTKNNLC